MHLSVKGKQMDVGDALRTYATENLGGLVSKYFSKPMEATVVFSRVAHLFRADISVHVGRGIMLQSNAEADEPYPAFDAAADKLAQRLRRYKSRLRDRHGQEHHGQKGDGTDLLPATKYILEAGPLSDHVDEGEPETGPKHGDGAAQPVIIAEMTTAIDTLTVGEAVTRMDMTGMPALMFRNRAHGGLNMIYRRSDGNVGWIDPKDVTTDSQGAGA